MSTRSRQHLRRFATFVALAGALAVSSNVLGEPPSDADRAYAAGVAAFKQHDYEAARASFLKSLELAPRTATRLNVALAEFYSGHALEALTHFRQFVAAPDAAPGRVEEVRTTMLPRVEAQIGRIQIEAPTGVTVLVDGVKVGTAPLGGPDEVMPGPHTVTAVGGSGRLASITLQAIAGEVVHARIVGEEPAGTSAPVAPATASTPLAPESSPPGFGGWTPAKKVTVIALGSGTVVSLGLGITFGLRWFAEKHSVDTFRQGLSLSTCAPNEGQALPATCSQLQEMLNTQATDGRLADVFYVGTAVFAVGAAASWIFWPSAKRGEAQAWVLPMVGRSNGLEFGASF
jgi:hypothetical protein